MYLSMFAFEFCLYREKDKERERECKVSRTVGDTNMGPGFCAVTLFAN